MVEALKHLARVPDGRVHGPAAACQAHQVGHAEGALLPQTAADQAEGLIDVCVGVAHWQKVNLYLLKDALIEEHGAKAKEAVVLVIPGCVVHLQEEPWRETPSYSWQL